MLLAFTDCKEIEMISLALILLAAPGLETNVVNQGNPSTGILCPVFMTKGEAIFGGPDVKPRGHNKVLQRHMCFTQVVIPLQSICIMQGYEENRCKARTIKWIKRKK
jgi:hypothetical protein